MEATNIVSVCVACAIYWSTEATKSNGRLLDRPLSLCDITVAHPNAESTKRRRKYGAIEPPYSEK